MTSSKPNRDAIRQECARHAFYTIGATMCPVDTGIQHGPERPAIIAHRYWCPSCDAQPGESCRLSPKFTQDYSHVSRHQVAQRALWKRLIDEIERGQSPISSIGFGTVGR